MRIYYKIVLVVTLLFFGFSFNGTGIKQGELKVTFHKHDAKQGLEILRSKAFSKINIEWNENYNTPSSVMGQLTESGFAKKSSLKEDAIQFLTQNKELFGLNNPASELKLISSFTDDLNQIHLKFQQMYENVIIYKGQIIVHISSDGRIIGVNGKYYPTPEFNTKPDITSLQAISAASGYMGAYKYNTPGTELFLLERGINFYLAYAVKLPSKDTPNMVIYIDASSGKIIYKDDGIRYDGPQVGTGIDLKNQTKQINTYLLSGKYYLVNAALPMYVPPFDSLKGVIDVYDAMNDTSGGGYNSAVLITDPNNDNNFNDNTRLKAAVSAHLYVRDAYLFYKSHFNRTSFDNAGHSMINVVHYMQSYNNAFWNGVCMSYGDGDNVKFSNLAGAFDVIVHAADGHPGRFGGACGAWRLRPARPQPRCAGIERVRPRRGRLHPARQPVRPGRKGPPAPRLGRRSLPAGLCDAHPVRPGIRAARQRPRQVHHRRAPAVRQHAHGRHGPHVRIAARSPGCRWRRLRRARVLLAARQNLWRGKPRKQRAAQQHAEAAGSAHHGLFQPDRPRRRSPGTDHPGLLPGPRARGCGHCRRGSPARDVRGPRRHRRLQGREQLPGRRVPQRAGAVPCGAAGAPLLADSSNVHSRRSGPPDAFALGGLFRCGRCGLPPQGALASRRATV